MSISADSAVYILIYLVILETTLSTSYIYYVYDVFNISFQ